jgi:hypothetical protein
MHETPTRELPVVPTTPGDADDRASVEPLNRFVALVEAIRWHETATSRPSVPRRPADHVLYRKLDEVQGLHAIPPASGADQGGSI